MRAPLSLSLLLAISWTTVMADETVWNGGRFYRLANGTRDVLKLVDSDDISSECTEELESFYKAVLNGQEWAWRMADAWGTQQSGLFIGDGLWEGSYEGCHTKSDKPPYINGHHCVVNYNADTGKEGLGVCVPTACKVYDVKTFLVEGKKSGHLDLPWKFPTSVWGFDSSWCSVPVQEKELDGSAIAAISILSLFLILVAIATTYDVIVTYCKSQNSEVAGVDPEPPRSAETAANGKVQNGSDTSHQPTGGIADSTEGATRTEGENIEMGRTNTTQSNKAIDSEKAKCKDILEQMLLAFSICRHVPSMLSFEHGKGSIQCLHGIRSLAFGWIVLGHSWDLGISLTSADTLSNGFSRDKKHFDASTMVLAKYNYAVDCFFILSGMLVTMSVLKKLEKNEFTCKYVPLYIFHRWLRLTPVYMMILMFYGTLFPYLGAGPFYNPLMNGVEGCKTYWWRNFFYLNNFWWSGVQDCLGWSWYLANDFQFYLMTPLFALALYKKPKLGIASVVVCTVISLVIRLVLYITVVKDFDSWFTNVYTTPWGRCSTYFEGILLGYLLFKKGIRPIKMNKCLVTFLWILALVIIGIVVYVPYTQRLEEWNDLGESFYSSIDRTLFGVGLCWITFACITGNGGIVNIILSWNGWLPISRLSYVGYLIHPIIIYFTYYSSPIQIYYSDWKFAYYFIGHFVMTLLVSLGVSVCLEVPFSALERIMLRAIQRKRRT